MAEGTLKSVPVGNVKERDAKYFEFLAEIKGLHNWAYNASTLTITASLTSQKEYDIFNAILTLFNGRVSKTVTSKRHVSAVRSFFEDQKRREQFEQFAHPVFAENDGDQHFCQFFASNLNDLNTLHELIHLHSKEVWSPEIVSDRYRLTAHRDLFVCIGDIVDYDDKDAGIVNPVIVKDSGQLAGKGKIFERLKEAGGVEYVSKLSDFDHQDGSFCVTTKGGQLDSLIIHPTRRVSNDQTKKDSVVDNLKDCLHVAQKFNLRRLVLPFMYSGSGGVSLKECAFFYACAIYEFCRETRNTYLGPYEIYFVEQSKQKAKSLMSYFNVMFPTKSSQRMFIPNDYARINLMAAHVYENQPHLPRVRVDSAYEPIELRVKDETAKTQFDKLKLHVEGETDNAVPGRRSSDVGQTEMNKHSDRTTASTAYEDIDSKSIFDIDEGPAQTDKTLYNDVNPKIVITDEKNRDYKEMPDTRLNVNTNVVDDYEVKPPNASDEIKKGHRSSHKILSPQVSGSRQEIEIADAKLSKDQCLFERSKTKLVIKNADIREEVVDAIVCPEYQTTNDFSGFIPNGIRCRFGIERESIEQKVFQTRRIATSLIPVSENRKEVTYVYHVKASLFQCGEYPITRNSEDNLRQTVEKVFDKLHRLSERNINSVAFPLIGSIDVADKELVKLLCSHFINVIFTCCDKRCDPGELEVFIVHPCATITRWLQESLYKKWNAGCS
ncbi:uncharacterized protein LOC127871084 isoform X3 [Dreissena polymorpha]|uniref:Macro domain-containing protein n=1 Tax=Dreissena polymorpha TaxID=45954 RepID=A0A9D4LDE0_DREPO|nr:uncharacterized protein LOC127871084 isoform X3 [Dreissena polymorpha]KAH3855759.1 hypothetical protein DPMN_098328 [Dreissena polymorpha]